MDIPIIMLSKEYMCYINKNDVSTNNLQNFIINLYVSTLIYMNTGHFTKDFSHKSFSTSFGPFAQFLEVISHNNYK